MDVRSKGEDGIKCECSSKSEKGKREKGEFGEVSRNRVRSEMR